MWRVLYSGNKIILPTRYTQSLGSRFPGERDGTSLLDSLVEMSPRMRKSVVVARFWERSVVTGIAGVWD